MPTKDWFNHKDELRYAIQKMRDEKSYESTYSFNLLDDGTNTWGLVFGWRDGKDFDEDENVLCGYLGYLPNNSMMGEFGYDWMMPYDEESGEVDDTELSIQCADISDLKWWEENWNRMVKDYRLEEW